MNAYACYTRYSSCRMPSSFPMVQNLSLGKGFVMMSASWLVVSTNSIRQSPLSTRSLMKQYLIYICLVLECMTRFLVKFIALVLSHLKGMWSRYNMVAIGVDDFLDFSIPNFLSNSIQYLDWLMKISLSNCFIWSPKEQDNSPILDISNSPFIVLANSLHKASFVAPKIIPST